MNVQNYLNELVGHTLIRVDTGRYNVNLIFQMVPAVLSKHAPPWIGIQGEFVCKNEGRTSEGNAEDPATSSSLLYFLNQRVTKVIFNNENKSTHITFEMGGEIEIKKDFAFPESYVLYSEGSIVPI